MDMYGYVYNYNDTFIIGFSIFFCIFFHVVHGSWFMVHICWVLGSSIFEMQSPPHHFQGVENGAINVGIFQCGQTQFGITQIRHR
jgi:hypothetical protein